jgi:protein-S-isoprenylcysteine O-methyltransferase
MLKRIIKAVIVSSTIAIIPVLGNRQMLSSPQVWIIFAVGILASVFQPGYNIVKDISESRDNGTELQIIWSVYITQLLAIIEAAYFRFPESVKWDLFASVSLIIILSGLAVRTWAIYTLGNYFTMHLSIQKGHKVILNGPYKYVRHPSYAGAFLIYAGIPILLHAWVAFIIAAIILPIAWIRRIHYEEKMLIEELGEEYNSYRKSVKKIIPGLW